MGNLKNEKKSPKIGKPIDRKSNDKPNDKRSPKESIMPHSSSEKHVMDSKNIEKAIKSILENSNVIEDYIQENNYLAKPGDQAKPSKGLNTNQLASLIKCDQQFVKKVSSIVAEMLLQSIDLKLSMFESLTMEYQGSINSLQNSLENLEKEKRICMHRSKNNNNTAEETVLSNMEFNLYQTIQKKIRIKQSKDLFKSI